MKIKQVNRNMGDFTGVKGQYYSVIYLCAEITPGLSP